MAIEDGSSGASIGETENAPTVFISYSWDSEGHKSWVLEFASALVESGVKVTLDEWDIQPGRDAIRFMERSVAECDFVLVICSPEYAAKANGRKGAAGYETTIITAHLIEDLDTAKFIPILRVGAWGPTSVPSWLRARQGVDLRDTSDYRRNFESLLRTLHRKAAARPKLGSAPVFEPLNPILSANNDRSDVPPSDSSGNSDRGGFELPSLASLIGSLRHSRSETTLSPKEQELLWNAAQDPSAQITHVKAIGGERLTVNNEVFPEQRNERVKAEWFGALRSLVLHGLLEGDGPYPDFYRLTAMGWEKSDQLGDFARWRVTEITLERRYVGADPDKLVLSCKKILQIPAAFYPDKISVKQPKTLIVEGIDPKLVRALTWEPTNALFVDGQFGTEEYFHLYPGTTVENQSLRLLVDG